MKNNQAAAALVRNTVVALRNIQSTLLSRQALVARMMDPRRNIEAECGHPDNLSVTDFDLKFKRGDVGARVISIYPEETWSQNPEVFETEDTQETEFEKAWKELNHRLSVYSRLQRADTLSGIGRFGIVLLGFNDGGSIDSPIPGMDETGEIVETGAQGAEPRKLLYMRPLDETVVTVKEIQSDHTNPRFGLPLFYDVQFADPTLGPNSTGVSSTSRKVHWSRAIHLADNRGNSEVYGAPRLERVFNRLLDLHKTVGGAGEMFWKGGFPGLSVETQPNIQDEIEFDKDATIEEMEKYMNGMSRYIATVGMAVKSLEVQISDPRPHVEVQLRLIAASIGVPWRVFVGSEQAQLASEQDMQTWNKRITRRREDYVSPFIIRPFVDRCMAVGALPRIERYTVFWPDVNTPSDEGRAIVAEKMAKAMKDYLESGADALIDPFHFLTLVMGMDENEATSIADKVGDALEEMRKAEADAAEMEAEAALSRQKQIPARNGVL